MDEATLRQLQDAILATDPQDVDTINILKDQYQRARKVYESTLPGATAPAGAAGAPDRGGSTGRGSDLPSARTAAVVTAGVPAKFAAGLLDLGGEGLRQLGRVRGFQSPDFPRFTPLVNRAEDIAAGEPVGESVGRSAFEGALMGPLSAPKTFAQGAGAILPMMLSGAASGGTAEALRERGAHPIAQFLASALAGYGTGKVATLFGRTPSEIVATPALRRATEGLQDADYAAAGVADRDMRAAGISPMPSQAFQVKAPGLEELQGAMLRSRAREADALRTDVAGQQPRVRELADTLRNAAGTNPRPDDDLASAIQELAAQRNAAGPKAVNEATRPLYNDPLGKAWTLNSSLGPQIAQAFDDAILSNRGNQAAVAALQQAKSHLLSVLGAGPTNLSTLSEALQSVRTNLAAYSEYPNAANQVRRVVNGLVAPLDDLIAQHAPDLASAPRVQAQLRSDLPSDFNDVSRLAGVTGGDPRRVIRATLESPEAFGTVSDKNQLLAQELQQWQINRAIEKATPKNPRKPFKGDEMRAELTRGPGGETFQKNLDVLFPGNPEAQEGLRRVLNVVANASQPAASSGQSRAPIAGVAEGIRLGFGSGAQQVGAAARVLNALTGGAADNAIIKVLRDPDVIKRLQYLSNLPKPALTRAAVAAALPQIFQEDPNAP